MIRVIRNKLFEEKLFTLTLVLTIVLIFFVDLRLEAVDFKVLASLFNLMLIALALEKYHLLDVLALKLLSLCHNERQLGIAIIIVTMILSMFVTNDVALLTMVPLTLMIGKRLGYPPFKLVVLETVAANIGSSLTPFGNPQNLYLYGYYHIPTLEFFKITGGFVTLGFLFLFVLALALRHEKLNFQLEIINVKSPLKVSYYVLLFIFAILSILRIIPYLSVTLLILLSFFIMDRHLLPKVDYYLLGTFINFFLLVDMITHMTFINNVLIFFNSQENLLFLISAFLSQGLSNVPTAILLSSFTKNYIPLLLGVSVGGMGTLIASMANLIAYKLYIKQYDSKPFLKDFYIINFTGLILFCILFSIYLLNQV